ncbi:MAG: serine/threonine protein kinase [Syntrophales bacterium]
MQKVFDHDLNRDICEFDYKGRLYRYPSQLLKRYELDSLLCCGGFGVLLVAKDTRIFNRKVLIKTGLLPPTLFDHPRDIALEKAVDENRKRMEHEKKLLLHGHLRGVGGIPTLIDWVEDINPMVWGPHKDAQGAVFYRKEPELWQTTTYLILSYFDGVELGAMCTRDKFKNNKLGACRYLGLYIANTLKAFHEKRPYGDNTLHFVYQDLKLENILCSYDGVYQLIDFGSFSVVTPRGPSNTGIGTEGYMAPEVKKIGLQAVTPQLDVYSLGIVLKLCLQICEGKKPDFSAGVSQLDISDDWKNFLQTCTATDPVQRFRDMSALIYGMPKPFNKEN